MNRNIANGKRVLFIATVDRHIEAFHLPLIKLLAEQGYKVDVASNGNLEFPFVQQKFNVPFTRNPLTLSNVKSYNIIKKIMGTYNYDIVHCHTPVGATVGRLAAKRSNAKILYTAHGFHFYKGAPIKNWILFYPIEKYLSKYTDLLITINTEDYSIAKRKFKSIKTIYLNGVGIEIDRMRKVECPKNLREELQLKDTDKIILSVGELNDNKNHKLVIKALSEIALKNIVYIIAGEGPLKEEIQSISKQYGIENQVKLLGYRSDIFSLMKQSDLFVFPSKREGLPVSVMEAMACDMIIIVSDIRGNRDLIENPNMRFETNDYGKLKEMILDVFSNYEKYKKLSQDINSKISNYSIDNINQQLLDSYREL
ncbi:glycosyltransferase family 4 protein [Vagococcus lutrae]|uniref:glycosyltransferase family 4 protein n=1 Tax=Vagococcus lutrae TaxID=81947 RepID=UPI00288E4A75|nr:glycosyltransferase family 4 protein [Vagococcus lutrae]MDT2805869.1 glycosyltransferase family 4 protein [Vagococcus lutrae]